MVLRTNCIHMYMHASAANLVNISRGIVVSFQAHTVPAQTVRPGVAVIQCRGCPSCLARHGVTAVPNGLSHP
jgi:hypothetical protein